MTITVAADYPDLLGGWIDRTSRQRDLRSRIATIRCDEDEWCGIRFAFYGRMSTEDFQDKLSSSQWQRDFAEELIGPHGRIMVSFFDVGISRRAPWHQRPQAAALLAALADPNRGFDAIVVGEFERAFFADQHTELAPIFERYGVQLWLPELEGPVDFADPMHLALLKTARRALQARGATSPVPRLGIDAGAGHRTGP